MTKSRLESKKKLTAIEVAQASADHRKKDFSDKVFIVTGANAGIGYETARALVSQNATVVLACRSPKLGKMAAIRLNAECPNRKPEEVKEDLRSFAMNDLCKFMHCDLSDFDSIREFVREFLESELPLHGLINNAGVWLKEESLTKQGFEGTWGVNHLGHFLLTYLLLDKLKESGPSRIITVSSAIHQRGKLNDEYPVRAYPKYSGSRFYADSKFMNVLFAKKLHRMLEDTSVTSYVLHPGVIPRSSLLRNVKIKGKRTMTKVASVFGKNTQTGAATTIYCALFPSVVEDAGCYFADCRVAKAKKKTDDVVLQDKLWKMSEELTGVVVEQK